MKNTKKNGAKRNPVLVLAVLGLLIGAGATGALAAGLVPSLDTGVSGSVSATVTNVPLLTVGPTTQTLGATVETAYTSGTGNDVKFGSTGLTIEAPGSAIFYLDLTVNKIGSGANALLINMKGIDEYTTVSLTATHGAEVAQTVTYMGNGEWATSNLAVTNYTLAFHIYVSQKTVRVDGAANPIWDFAISEANLVMAP